jgi:putative spermidine/putrescine transport system permease protein
VNPAVTRIPWTNRLLLLPALAWLGIVFVYPLGRLLWASLFTPTLSLASYARLLGSSIYLTVFVNTFEISATVTMLALALGYPLAFVLATAGPRVSRLMLAAIIVPLWTSVLVRTYAWMVLLGRRGLVNEGLQSLGLLDAPLPLLYNRLGVTIGMVHVLLPFMVLPIYSVMKGIDVDLLKAAQNLGANRRQAFLRVYVPLSLSGLATGSLLVFVSALGFFVTPALLGGRRDMMIAMLIDNQISQLLDWGLGSALAVVLFAITAGLLLAVQRFTRAERLWARIP